MGKEPEHFHRLNALLRIAGKCMARGDYQRAGELLVRSRQTPFYAPSPERDSLIAAYLFHTAPKENALEAIRVALHSNARSSSVLLSMALLLRRLNDPGWKPALLAAALYAKTPPEEAAVCNAADRFQCAYVALGMLRRSLKQTPTRFSAAYNLCVLQLRRGDLAEGTRLAHLLRELDPLDRQVERLFATVRQLEEAQADETEVRRAGKQQCFYGVPDGVIVAEDVMEFSSRLTDHLGDFFTALRQDERLRGQLLRVLHLHPDLYHMIPALCEEMPDVIVAKDPMTTETLISGQGELELEIVRQKLQSKFGADAVFKDPKIAYRESIRKTIQVQGRHKKQSGGHGQFGDVWIEFSPAEPGTDFEFVDAVVGGAVPRNFIPSVEKGLRENLVKGVLAGFPMTGLRAKLYDGSYHPVDSSEMAFKTAARIAYKQCINANPVLLEPIMHVEISVPDEYMGDIMGDLNKRRGRILGMEQSDGKQLIIAEVPQAEMFKYATDLRSMTQAKGAFKMNFERYEEVPQAISSKIIEAHKADLADDEE